MKILGCLLALILSACVSPDSGSATLITCPAADPKTGDPCCQFPDGYQCGPCVCGPSGWVCHPVPDGGPDGGGPIVCPPGSPRPGDSCSQFPADYQCGRCVCSKNQLWTCS